MGGRLRWEAAARCAAGWGGGGEWCGVGESVVVVVYQLRVLERIRMVAAVRVPVLELPPPRGAQLSLRGVRRDTEYEVVIG